MTEPFLAEIRIFPFNFAPRGWAFCDGQLVPIRQSTALFSLVGTTYGGDGQTTFALPNLQGNVPMFWGQGPGDQHVLGETGGSPTVALSAAEMPAHTHTMLAFSLSTPSAVAPTGELVADGVGCKPFGSSGLSSNTQLHPQAVSLAAGGSGAHNNMMPSLVLNFCIALEGVFPQRP
jgi:microcystin-dependent protein